MADRDAAIDLESVIRKAVRYEFDSRGLRKNGETWKAYVARQITPERLGLLALLIFNLGGGVRDAQEQLRRAAVQAQTASTKADTASQRADSTAQALDATRRQLDQMAADLKRQSDANRDVQDRIAMSVTRSEFASAIAQQVLPRLERIERRLDTTP